jgi:hypothetical protein
MNTDDREVETELERMRARMREDARAAGAGAPASFASGFSDRVMQRINASAARPSLADGLETVFRRLAPLAAAAVLLLSTLNLMSSRHTDRSVTERLLGLPTVTVATALSFDGDFAMWGP